MTHSVENRCRCSDHYLAVFLCVAQRRLAASAIRARPSGDRFRFFFVFAAFVTAVGKAFSALRGRPAFRGAAFPVESAFNSWRASFRVAISASSNAITSLIAIARIIASPPRSCHRSKPQVVVGGDGNVLLGAKVAFCDSDTLSHQNADSCSRKDCGDSFGPACPGEVVAGQDGPDEMSPQSAGSLSPISFKDGTKMTRRHSLVSRAQIAPSLY